uniref:hypothetical protein n=1 Tax=Enterocloster clostridioformis TaxID=1531 RepID=UPI001C3E0AE1|nr:hypothetical protein [Enterocloster clostridioformis]
MEYSQINALFKRDVNDYELWNLTLSREKIQEIGQVQEDIAGDLRQIFEGLPLDDGKTENNIHFALPHQDRLRLITVDMGEGFTDRNRYNGSSVRGSREEITAELREALKAQGYALHSNAAFVDVDVIATLQKIMERNTDFYQTDFQYDVETLREAAEDRGGYRGFFWLTRKSGTWCFPERDVYIRNTNAANTWMYYGGSGSENVKAYWIDVKRVEGDDRKIIGDIVEMDYQKHLDYLCTHSLDPAYVEVVFKSPNDLCLFPYREYQENWQTIGQRYGTVERVKYLVENQQELTRAAILAHGLIWEAAEPMELDAYLKRMEQERLHDYGYTAGDVRRIGPLDAEKAVKHGLECYALHTDGTKELIADREAFQQHLFHDGLFGITGQENQLLQYFKQDCIPLFTPEETRLICGLAIQSGKEAGRDSAGLLDSIIRKAELSMGQSESMEREPCAVYDHEEQEGLCRDS